MTQEYLSAYKSYLVAANLPQHNSHNKLRDVLNIFSDHGHEFSLNKEILYSFDVCGNCEAHAILLAVTNGIRMKGIPHNEPVTIKNAGLLKDLHSSLITNNPHFVKCPVMKDLSNT